MKPNPNKMNAIDEEYAAEEDGVNDAKDNGNDDTKADGNDAAADTVKKAVVEPHNLEEEGEQVATAPGPGLDPGPRLWQDLTARNSSLNKQHNILFEIVCVVVDSCDKSF